MVADVDALQNLYLRGLEPPLVALLAGAVSIGVAAAFLPAAGLVLAVGLLDGRRAGALPSGSRRRGRAGRRRPRAAALSAELVELMRGAPELVAFGAEQAALDARRVADRALVKLARRDALAAGWPMDSRLVVTGADRRRRARGRRHRVGRRRLRPGAGRDVRSARARRVRGRYARSARPPASCRRRSPRAGACSSSPSQHRAPSGPGAPVPAPVWPFAVALEGVRRAYPGQGRPRSTTSASGSSRASGSRWSARAAPAKTTVANLCCAFSIPSADGDLGGRDCASTARTTSVGLISVAGQESHLFSATIRDNVRLPRPDATDDEVEVRCGGHGSGTGSAASPTGSRRASARRGASSRAARGSDRARAGAGRRRAGTGARRADRPPGSRDGEELVDDVFAAAGDRTVLLITHRAEGLDLVDRVVTL